MGFLRKRHTYSPLSTPSLHVISLPDLALLNRDGAIINEISRAALENVENISADVQRFSPSLAAFEREILAELSGG
jgi:hypothetical protein